MKKRNSRGNVGRSIVHIGTHKTGTTAFQNYMRENIAHFRDRGLSYYVQEGTGSPQAHELALIALRDELVIPIRLRSPDVALHEAKEVMAARVHRFLAENQECLTLLSHEALSFLRETQEVERLRSLLGPKREVTILLVLRDPAAYLEAWKHQLKVMDLDDSSPYRTSFMYTERDSWLVDYDRLVSVYSQVFGRDRVVVLSYEEEMERHGSIVPAILLRCGYPPDTLPPGWDRIRNSRSTER